MNEAIKWFAIGLFSGGFIFFLLKIMMCRIDKKKLIRLANRKFDEGNVCKLGIYQDLLNNTITCTWESNEGKPGSMTINKE